MSKRPVCAITGATGGIGAALSQHAVNKGYNLILHGRSEEKLSELAERLRRTNYQLSVELVVGDLGTAAKARNVAASISALAPNLDILFNNAGVLLDGVQMSEDGLEMHTQVNLIAPYILMQELKFNVARASGAIINISSGSALRVKSLSAQNLKQPHTTKKLFGAYAESKLALSVVTRELAKEFAESGVAIACADPGPNKTGMTSGAGMPKPLLLLRPFLYKSPEKGASAVFKAAILVKLDGHSGAFYSSGKIKDLPKFTKAPEIEEMLKAFCKLNGRA